MRYTLVYLRCTWDTLRYHWGNNDTLRDTWRNIRDTEVPPMCMRDLVTLEKTIVSTLIKSFEAYRWIDLDPWLTADRPQDTLRVSMAAPTNMNPPGNRRIYMRRDDIMATKARAAYIMTYLFGRALRTTLGDTLRIPSATTVTYLEMPPMYMGYLEIPLGKQRHFKRYLEKHSEHQDTFHVHDTT